MKLTNKELRQKLNELMDEIISVKEWIFNAIEIEPVSYTHLRAHET